MLRDSIRATICLRWCTVTAGVDGLRMGEAIGEEPKGTVWLRLATLTRLSCSIWILIRKY